MLREGVSRASQGKRNSAFRGANLYMGAWDQVLRAQQWGVTDHRFQCTNLYNGVCDRISSAQGWGDSVCLPLTAWGGNVKGARYPTL